MEAMILFSYLIMGRSDYRRGTTKIIFCETAEVTNMSLMSVFHGSQLN